MAKKQKTDSQFMHLELYSRAGNESKTSLDGVVGEALRLEGFISHLLDEGLVPEPPTYLYSQGNKTLEQHSDELVAQVETEKDSLGRRIKTDKNVLLAGVASYPKPRLADNWTDEDRVNYQEFKNQSIVFLQKKWGDDLLCVLEHTDEEYLHFHFYVTNKTRIASTPELHPGQAENIRLENEAKIAGVAVNKKEQVAAYKTAMQKFQDEYFEQVSVYCGLDRLGPKVQRLNRKEWKERKRVNKKIAEVIRATRSTAETAIRQQAQLETQLNLLAGMDDLALAKFIRENHSQIIDEFNTMKISKPKV